MSSSGITTDFLIYSIIIPVMPFHLQALGYTDISALVGYLLFAYVRIDRPSVCLHFFTNLVLFPPPSQAA
jgi:hypothetical protein